MTRTLLAAGVAALLAASCAPFAISTPDGMISLTQASWSPYDYRATTAQGVVVAARQVRMRENGDVPPADLDFWIEATQLRLRTTAAYASLGQEDIRSSDGTPGVLLSFGRDDDGSTYRYDVALFVTKRFVHVLEAGGNEELFDASSAQIDEAFGSYTVRR